METRHLIIQLNIDAKAAYEETLGITAKNESIPTQIRNLFEEKPNNFDEIINSLNLKLIENCFLHYVQFIFSIFTALKDDFNLNQVLTDQGLMRFYDNQWFFMRWRYKPDAHFNYSWKLPSKKRLEGKVSPRLIDEVENERGLTTIEINLQMCYNLIVEVEDFLTINKEHHDYKKHVGLLHTAAHILVEHFKFFYKSSESFESFVEEHPEFKITLTKKMGKHCALIQHYSFFN